MQLSIVKKLPTNHTLFHINKEEGLEFEVWSLRFEACPEKARRVDGSNVEGSLPKAYLLLILLRHQSFDPDCPRFYEFLYRNGLKKGKAPDFVTFPFNDFFVLNISGCHVFLTLGPPPLLIPVQIDQYLRVRICSASTHPCRTKDSTFAIPKSLRVLFLDSMLHLPISIWF